MLFTVRNLPFVFMLVSITSLLLNAHAQIADENGPPSSPMASSAEGNTLLAALKRVFMSTPPAELFKNLSRITFYRHVPPQTQVINLPIGTDEDSSSSLNTAPTASTLNFSKAAAQMMFHSFLPTQNAQFSPICSQPQQVGNGPYRIPRWFFNTGQLRCELFYWSGCCGNANNFQSMDQCERACRGIHSQISASSTSQHDLSSPKPQNSSPPNTLVYVPVSLTLSMPRSAARVQEQQRRPQLRRVQAATAASSSLRSASLALTSADEEELSPPEFPVRDADVEQQNDQTTTTPSGAAMRPMNGTHPPRPRTGMANRFSAFGETPMLNPCAYGAGQFTLCKPTTTATAHSCSGQQFCHVGDSPITTVCCNKPAAIDVCQQPLNVGVGPSNLVRWFFFSPTAQCQSFMYKGLQGNENNFLSRLDCEQSCHAANPCAVGTPYRDQHQGQFGYCSATQQNVCAAGYYCHVGGDPGTSLCCPIMAGDPCTQPVNAGVGYYKLQRWFWDSASMECKLFIYCGQKGNQNNFISKPECEQHCQPNPCRLHVDMPLQQCVPEPGACDGRPDMYCHVGANPGTTVCCPTEPIDPCLQPVEAGVGHDQLERFAFDVQSQQCSPFIYRGLKGNRNNFLSQEQCEMACSPNPCPSGNPFVGADGRIQSCAVSTSMSTCPNGFWCHIGANSATTVCCPEANPNPCQLPMSTGEGPFRLERFYFDLVSKTCKSFIYKGLKGNQNNFHNLRSCQLSCLPLDTSQSSKSINSIVAWLFVVIL